MSKFYDKLKKYEEALEQESLRVAESIERAGSEITESIDAHLTLEGRKEEYEAFFMKKLEKYGVSSPAELDEKDKKKFFNEIDSEYTGELDEMMMKKLLYHNLSLMMTVKLLSRFLINQVSIHKVKLTKK